MAIWGNKSSVIYRNAAIVTSRPVVPGPIAEPEPPYALAAGSQLNQASIGGPYKTTKLRVVHLLTSLRSVPLGLALLMVVLSSSIVGDLMGSVKLPTIMSVVTTAFLVALQTLDFVALNSCTILPGILLAHCR